MQDLNVTSFKVNDTNTAKIAPDTNANLSKKYDATSSIRKAQDFSESFNKSNATTSATIIAQILKETISKIYDTYSTTKVPDLNATSSEFFYTNLTKIQGAWFEPYFF